jgi:uncharacterized cupredoxin-like copper-binding protein
MLKRIFQIGLCFLLMLTLWIHPSSAQAAMSKPIELHIHLGNAENELVFVPDRLQFRANQRYKLILDNPSAQKHYFTAKDFADGIWTQKVDAGNVEIKGAIHELEVRPGAIAEWVFIPLRPGSYELRCRIAGHTEAGMKGEITIEG